MDYVHFVLEKLKINTSPSLRDAWITQSFLKTKDAQQILMSKISHN